MLRSLQVKNYVLIDSLDIEFPEGLVIITGQTGAGKSIILGAISLALGGKSDASVISADADTCVVEAEFTVGEDAALRETLEENDIEWDGGHLLVRRVVYRTGRSRSFVNDAPLPLPVLQEIASHLVDIHSQHQTLLLTDHRHQLSMLDAYAGNAQVLASCRSDFQKLSSLRSELLQVQENLDKVLAEKEYNEAMLAELESARLKEGELEELDAEQKQLANAEEIKEVLSGIESVFSGGDEVAPLCTSLKEVQRSLARIARFFPAMESLSERLDSARLELEDISGEISSANSSVELSQERLEQVEDRMALLYDLLRKHQCRTVEELIAVRQRFSEAVSDSSSLVLRKEELERLIEAAQKTLDSDVAALHASRAKAATPFAQEIQNLVRSLELDNAVFEVDLKDALVSQTGADTVSFLFAAVGQTPADIAKCASGGELSRIMLCLKAMKARYSEMPTMVFDEIDTGVSGSVADKMGSMICTMGHDMQVFAITHLPQVAAKGDAHYLVSKSVQNGAAATTIKRLSPEERVMEVARMLSGSSVTEAAISNARSLIGR